MTEYKGAIHLQKVIETTKLTYDVGRLDLSVVEAKDLLDKDFFTVSDPYCIIKIGTEEARTARIKDNLNPVWNENFQLYFIHPIGEPFKVEFTLMDKDAIVDDLLGKASFDITKLDGENLYDAWLELDTKGKLRVKMRLISMGTHQIKFMQLSQHAAQQQTAISTVAQQKDVEIQKLAHELNVVKSLKLDDTNHLNQQLLIYKNTLETEQAKNAQLVQQFNVNKAQLDAKTKENEDLKKALQVQPKKSCIIL